LAENPGNGGIVFHPGINLFGEFIPAFDRPEVDPDELQGAGEHVGVSIHKARDDQSAGKGDDPGIHPGLFPDRFFIAQSDDLRRRKSNRPPLGRSIGHE
jgi:hypothetical protein